MRLKQKIQNLYRNLVYLTQQDYKRSLSFMLHEGRRQERDSPTDLKHCPICGAELERAVRLNGEIISFCPRWQIHPDDQVQLPFPEPHTDKMQMTLIPRPLQTFLHAQQAGAGPHTAITQAIPKQKR